MHLPMKDILEASQFHKHDLEFIFSTSEKMEKILTGEKKWNLLKWKIMACLFYEPSTRTRFSFECAMKKLGGDVITVTSGENSSLNKWESLEDNAKINTLYSDIIVMRHPTAWSVHTTAESTHIPVINAWDGANEHPTQALLDVYTIQKEKKTLEWLHIAIVWDLKYGRTTHSLVRLMWLFKNTSFTFISPDSLRIPSKIIDFLSNNDISYEETSDYQKWIQKADILYVTRLQKERFENIDQYDAIKDLFILTPDILKNAKKDITILHPLPRVNEIDPTIDSLPNAAYFRQAYNAIPVRMALLYLLLKK